jgi:hypothetical protein
MSALTVHAKEILLHPKQEWRVIEGEPETVGGLYRRYIVPLAAIGPAAAIIGMSVFGLRVPFVGRYRMPFGSALASGIVRYVLALVGVFVLAVIIDALAPRFGGTSNRIQALKLAAYGSTAAWLAGAFALVPPLAILGVLGLYSLYLLYLGLPILMKAPEEKAGVYTAAVVAAAIVVFVVFGWIASLFIRWPAHHAY